MFVMNSFILAQLLKASAGVGGFHSLSLRLWKTVKTIGSGVPGMGSERAEIVANPYIVVYRTKSKTVSHVILIIWHKRTFNTSGKIEHILEMLGTLRSEV